jgi:membrane associated rhomboid family serine protease
MPDLPRRRRPPRPSWTEPIAQRLTPAIKALVITDALLYFLFVFVRDARPLILSHLALGPGFFQGQLWQPVTSLFVHSQALGFVFNLIGLWFVGAFIESTQGTRRFLGVFFTAGILANVAIGVVSHLCGVVDVYDGCSFAVLALFMAYGRIYGRQQTQVLGRLFLQARNLALILLGWAVVMDVIQGFTRGDWGALAGTLVASAIGYLGATRGGLREIYDVLRARRLRRRYRVIEGGASRRARSPKYWN